MSIPPVSPLLALPAEIRNYIYDYALRRPDPWAIPHIGYEESRQVRQVRMLSSHPMAKFPKPCLSTPSILLANRQIYREAKAILNKKLFVIDLTHLQRLDVDPVPDIMEFIGIITLQKLQHTRLELTFEGTAYGWLKDVDALIDVWSQECSLQTLEVTILDEDQDLRDGWYPASVISELQRMSQRLCDLGTRFPITISRLYAPDQGLGFSLKQITSVLGALR